MTIAIDRREADVTAEQGTMRAAVLHAPGDLRVERVPKPVPGAGEALIRVTLTTICGTDVHILKGEYPVARAW
jgi:alcohol dehydrogenase